MRTIKDLNVEGAREALSRAGQRAALEGAFLLRRTGLPLAAWTRTSIPHEVISVMAATMLSSIETLVGVVGDPRPESIVVETDRHRLLIRAVDAGAFLVLIAPASTQAHELRREARRIVAQIAAGGTRFGRAEDDSSASASSDDVPQGFLRV